MTNREIEILEDMKAYMDFCMKHNTTLDECLVTIAHDCGGLLRQEECFGPRTSGYAEHMKKQ